MKIIQIYCPICQASFVMDEAQFRNITWDVSKCTKCNANTKIAKLEIE